MAAERALDQNFAAGTVTEAGLHDAVTELASLEGQLRTAHLTAHIAMLDLLTTHQVHRYSELRAYGSGHGHGAS